MPNDIKHKTAAILKRELHDEPDWQAFVKQAAATSKKVQQTPLAALAPSNQRSKARYMNAEKLIKWANEQIAYLDMKKAQSPETFESSGHFQKLGWLYDFREQLAQWKSLFKSLETVGQYINFMGLETGVDRELAKVFELPDTQRYEHVREELALLLTRTFNSII